MKHLLTLLAVGCAFVGGVALGVKSTSAQLAFGDIQRNVRMALGLPKMWMPIPDPDPSKHERVACPEPEDTMVIVTGGQSNAANSNSSRSSTSTEDRVFTYYAGECFVTADPVLGASGINGSLWPDLGRRLTHALDQPILFVHGAIGGTQVEDWIDERSGYLAHLLESVDAARSAGYEPDWILWHQGETDALVQDGELFTQALEALTRRLLDQMPGARLYLFRASKCTGPRRFDGVPMIVDAQTKIAEANPRIVPGVNTDQFGINFRWDTCHLNEDGRAAVNALVAADLTEH